MIDPIYEYSPGKGWVATTQDTITMRCGTVVTFEMRKPRPDERYEAFFLYRKPEYIKQRFREIDFTSLAVFRTGKFYSPQEYQYAVVTRVG